MSRGERQEEKEIQIALSPPVPVPSRRLWPRQLASRPTSLRPDSASPLLDSLESGNGSLRRGPIQRPIVDLR